MTEITANHFCEEERVEAYLNQVSALQKKIRNLEYYIRQLDEMTLSLPSPGDCSAVRVRDTQQADARYVKPLAIKDLQLQKLDLYNCWLLKLKNQIFKVITDSIPDPDFESLVLIDSYVLCKKTTEIALMLECHRRTVEKARVSGISRLRLPPDAIWIEELERSSDLFKEDIHSA